jgi:predicted N-formylglutamate amidohydrolase
MARTLRADARGPFVIFCDHASNQVPPELHDLGLPPSELARHIAWDIGAAGITEELSKRFDSPAILCTTSRLVIDCNRQLTARDLIPEVSDRTVIPGNLGLDEKAKRERIERWFNPYHRAVEAVFTDREARGVKTISLSIHTMTDNLAGNPRPWQISLSSYTDRSLADPVLEALRRQADITVGDNEPYDLDPAVDFGTPFHALRRGLPHLQVEFRQDLVGDVEGQIRWAARFAEALAEVVR